MRIKTTVKKMTLAEAQKVSLVKRAASRIPFRVVKSEKNSEENGMIDLARILKREVAPAKPKAVAVVVQKADASEDLKAQLVEAGFEVGEVVENADNTVSYVLKGESLEGAELDVIKQADDMLVVMKDFRPYTSDLTDFAEMAQAQGFYSSICTASDILSGAINQALAEADSPSDAATQIGTMIDAYKKYVMGMASALPQMAFKAETVVKAVKGKKKPKDGSTDVKKVLAASTEVANPQMGFNQEVAVGGTEQVTKTGEGAEPKVEATKAEGATKVEATTAATTATPATEAKPVAEPAKQPELQEILKAELDKFVQSLDSVRNELAEVRKAQETLQASVKESVEKTDKLEQKLGSTLISTPPGEDQPSGHTTTKKSEDWKPLTDTAFSSRSKKYR